MRLPVVLLVVSLLGACAPMSETRPMFTPADFAHLRFLEGRWEGTGPDGAPFYEQYSFPSQTEMRSTRYGDATFAQAEDGSVVALHTGRVTSTWMTFTWEAVELVPGKACFEPLQAPSAFCWERLTADAAQVTQRWTDEAGQAQQYVVPLRRL